MFDKIFEVKMPVVQRTTMLICSTMQECMDHKEVSLLIVAVPTLETDRFSGRRALCHFLRLFLVLTGSFDIMRRTREIPCRFLTEKIQSTINNFGFSIVRL
jgi:hypothetical protein